MSGLYIHIPFCASRCIYCAFYSTTLLTMADKYVDALCKEMRLRHNEIDTVETIYLGGGTPSVLSIANLQKIFAQIKTSFKTAPDMEVTIECNPDDVTEDFARGIAALPINRVSMGVQTFDNQRLKFLHRRHNKEEVYTAVRRLKSVGFENISIDLMFGFPGEQLSDFKLDIEEALKLDIQHISAYSLMYEANTPLQRMLQTGRITPIEEEKSFQMFKMLSKELANAGFEHYEISNFARLRSTNSGNTRSFRSRHNSSYWHAIPYLGIGAAAHSYDVKTRKWNVSNLKQYINSIQQGILPLEIEVLDEQTRYNDCITTALRTKEGIDLDWLRRNFSSIYYDYLMHESAPHIASKNIYIHENHLALTEQGWFISDMIMSDLIHI